MIISLIAAVADNNVIGKDGQLPWHISEDLKYFKRTTLNHTLIMGRKTLESFPNAKPLPNRRHIVLTRQPDWQAEGVEVAYSLPAALAMAQGEDEIFIIGGAEIYQQALALAHRLYITRVHLNPDGDAVFPEIPNRFKIVSQQSGETTTPTLEFLVYEDRT